MLQQVRLLLFELLMMNSDDEQGEGTRGSRKSAAARAAESQVSLGRLCGALSEGVSQSHRADYRCAGVGAGIQVLRLLCDLFLFFRRVAHLHERPERISDRVKL